MKTIDQPRFHLKDEPVPEVTQSVYHMADHSCYTFSTELCSRYGDAYRGNDGNYWDNYQKMSDRSSNVLQKLIEENKKLADGNVFVFFRKSKKTNYRSWTGWNFLTDEGDSAKRSGAAFLGGEMTMEGSLKNTSLQEVRDELSKNKLAHICFDHLEMYLTQTNRARLVYKHIYKIEDDKVYALKNDITTVNLNHNITIMEFLKHCLPEDANDEQLAFIFRFIAFSHILKALYKNKHLFWEADLDAPNDGKTYKMNKMIYAVEQWYETFHTGNTEKAKKLQDEICDYSYELPANEKENMIAQINEYMNDVAPALGTYNLLATNQQNKE